MLWLIDGPVARPEAGWTPTPGCKACDEESSGVKRRGRPFNHTPECAEKQAVFRERLRKVKILSADEAPVMEPVAGPVLPWPGTGETPKASSSSSGVVIPQPVAVEPDPVSRGHLMVVLWKSLKSVRWSLMST